MSFYFSHDSENHEQFNNGGKDLVSLIERALDGSDYDNGELETARDTANNCASFLARLSLCLLEKGLLTPEELKKVIDPSTLGYEDGEYKWP